MVSIILFIIFALSLSALVIGCLAYTKRPTKPFMLPPRTQPFKPLSEITCTKLGGIPIESGCEFPDTYAKGFKQCTGQITPNKVIIPWDRNEISRQCQTLFPMNPIDGPEPPPLTAESALTCCPATHGSRTCSSGGCCCNMFGCNCNNCEGTGKGCSTACYLCSNQAGIPHDCYGTCGGGPGADDLDNACIPPAGETTCEGGLDGGCQHSGCTCHVFADGAPKSCPW